VQFMYRSSGRAKQTNTAKYSIYDVFSFRITAVGTRGFSTIFGEKIFKCH
jgi:hypothetical protein